jgi:hypothetical protein
MSQNNALDRIDDIPVDNPNPDDNAITIDDHFLNDRDINNNVIIDYPIDDDSDQESYIDDSSNYTDSDDDIDRADDLENLILDQLEFEFNNRLLFGHDQSNSDESIADDDNNNNNNNNNNDNQTFFDDYGVDSHQ